MEHNVSDDLNLIIKRIVDELLAQTSFYRYDGRTTETGECKHLLPDCKMVTNEDLKAIPIEFRPELAGNLMKPSLNPDQNAYPLLLELYQDSKENPDPEKRWLAYHLFRQGLDLQDLDPVMYEMINTNPNSMGHWFPALVDAAAHQDYFKIPKTTIIKLPLTLLQLTRLDYARHTPTTLQIVDEYCYRAFDLDETQTYFIRTGTSSLKYDFRNVKVTGAKEVHELGEYLLYNHFRGVEMAGPLSRPSIYGMQTTVEWAVLEYIEPKEELPQIYFGMPLRLELRAFIDADEKKLLGIAPYWEPSLMKKRFSMDSDFLNPDKIHDYAVFTAYEDILMKKYEDYKDKIAEKIESLLPYLNLTGQWSLDVMVNGTNDDGSDDVYLIDMSTAQSSALSECVPRGLLKPLEEDWIPHIPDLLPKHTE